MNYQQLYRAYSFCYKLCTHFVFIYISIVQVHKCCVHMVQSSQVVGQLLWTMSGVKAQRTHLPSVPTSVTASLGVVMMMM